MIINVVLIAAGVPMLIWLGATVADSVIPESNGLAIVRTVVQVIAAIAFAITGMIALLIVARIIAAPMMTRLSAAVEQVMLGDAYVERTSGIRTELVDVGRGIGFAVGRLVVFVVLYPLILLLGLIPVAGPVLVPLCSFLYGAFVLSLDFSEPAFERHLPGFRRRLRYVLDHRATYLGFGGMAVAMAMIPFANLIVLPVCVTAATIVFLESQSDRIVRV